MSQKSTHKLPLAVKLGYASAEGANSLFFTLFYVYGMYFFTDVVVLNPAFAGVILGAGTFWDAVTDPAVGIWSDRTRCRWGRRRPFLFAVAAPYGVISWMLFTDPGLGLTMTEAYFVSMVVLYFTVFTLLNIPHTALAPEMTQDYDERTSLVSYRAFISQVASIAGAALPLVMARYFAGVLGNRKLGWSAMAAVFGALCIPLILITWRATRGYELFPQETRIHWKDIVAATLRNRPFCWTVGLYSFGLAAQAITGAVGVYFQVYYLGFSEKQTSLGFLVLFASSALWVPVIALVSSRLGKRGTYILFSALWAAVSGPAMWFLRRGDGLWFYVLMVFVGPGLIGVYQLGWAMIPDTVEVDEFRSGYRREGLYNGIASFIQKASNALVLWLTGVVLVWVGYVANAPQTAGALIGIRILYAWGATACIALSVLCAYFLPMTRARHRALLEAIALKKAGKPWDEKEITSLIR